MTNINLTAHTQLPKRLVYQVYLKQWTVCNIILVYTMSPNLWRMNTRSLKLYMNRPLEYKEISL
jgi:hypothetical protein